MSRESSAALLPPPPSGTKAQGSRDVSDVLYIDGNRFEFENGGKDQSVSESDRDVVTLQRDGDEEEGKEGFRLCPDDEENSEKAQEGLRLWKNLLLKKPSLRCRNTKKKPSRPFKCRLCRKRFTFQNTLILHLRSHSAGKPLVCPVCGLNFYLMTRLNSHMTTHTGAAAAAAAPKKPFACRVRGRRFSCLQRLKEHAAFHSDLKLCRCSQCHKVFPTAQGLKNHVRVHTGEKPFLCPLCGRGFKQKSALNVHSATHSGERPHLCFICGKSYCRADVLKVHLRVHTGERPYRCDQCEKSFYYRQGFIIHKKTHKPKPMGPSRQRGRPRRQVQASPRKSHRTGKVSHGGRTGAGNKVDQQRWT